MTLIQKFNGCLLKFADSKPNLYKFAGNVIRLALIDMQKIAGDDSQLFNIFLDEYRKNG